MSAFVAGHKSGRLPARCMPAAPGTRVMWTQPSASLVSNSRDRSFLCLLLSRGEPSLQLEFDGAIDGDANHACLPVRPTVGGKRFVFLGMEFLYGDRRMIFDTRFGWNLEIASRHRIRLRAGCRMPRKVLEGT